MKYRNVKEILKTVFEGFIDMNFSPLERDYILAWSMYSKGIILDHVDNDKYPIDIIRDHETDLRNYRHNLWG